MIGFSGFKSMGIILSIISAFDFKTKWSIDECVFAWTLVGSFIVDK